MICRECRELDGPANHEACRGSSWCDCQHRVSRSTEGGPAQIVHTMQNPVAVDHIPFGLYHLLQKKEEADYDGASG